VARGLSVEWCPRCRMARVGDGLLVAERCGRRRPQSRRSLDEAHVPGAGQPGRPYALLVRVLVLNGPNLGRLGAREPEVYGSATYDDLARTCREAAEALGLEADVRQTDDEVELLRWLHEAADGRIPVVLNPAAFTHYSYAVRDACAQLRAPLVEVHLTNPATRERFRHTSVVAGVATGTIAGFGLGSYELALRAVAALTDRSGPPVPQP
jgi:3-dehydroquinate dehydratase-2